MDEYEYHDLMQDTYWKLEAEGRKSPRYRITYRMYADSGSCDSDMISSLDVTEEGLQKWIDTNHLHWEGIYVDDDGNATRVDSDVHYTRVPELITIEDLQVEHVSSIPSAKIVQLCKEIEEEEKAALEAQKLKELEEKAARKVERDKKEYERLKAKFEEANG